MKSSAFVTGLCALAPLAVLAIPTGDVSHTNGAPNIADRNFQTTVLDAHNKARADHQAPPLQWNANLAAAAQAWANTCVWEHSSGRVGPYGENMLGAYIPVPAKYDFPSASVVTDAWNLEEEKMYDVNKPSFSHETGHFTQVVWKDTKAVGCAWTNVTCATNGNSQLFYNMVCEYYPQGNILGGKDGVQWFVENVLPRTQ